MENLNILIYIPHQDSGQLGGAQVRTIEVIKRGKKHGINYTVVENKPSFRNLYNLENVYEINSYGYPKSIISYFKMLIEFLFIGLKRIKRDDIDLIVSPYESPFCVFPAYVTSKLTGTPWTSLLQSVPVYWYITNHEKKYTSKFMDIYRHLSIHKYHGDNVFFSAITRWLIYKMLRDTKVVAIRSIAKTIQKVDNKLKIIGLYPGYGIDYEKIFAIPNSDIKEYDAIFASALFSGKGVYDVIDAWSIVVKKIPSAKLCIVGRGNEQNAKKINKKIKKMNLETNIFLPYDPLKGASLEELWPLMKKCKILIHPSIIDSWSLVIGEALACGLPVITYDIEPIKEAYGNCPIVFRVNVKDIKNIAIKTLEILKNDNLLKEYSIHAMECAKSYDWNNAVIAEKKVYELLLNKK